MKTFLSVLLLVTCSFATQCFFIFNKDGSSVKYLIDGVQSITVDTNQIKILSIHTTYDTYYWSNVSRIRFVDTTDVVPWVNYTVTVHMFQTSTLPYLGVPADSCGIMFEYGMTTLGTPITPYDNRVAIWNDLHTSEGQAADTTGDAPIRGYKFWPYKDGTCTFTVKVPAELYDAICSHVYMVLKKFPQSLFNPPNQEILKDQDGCGLTVITLNEIVGVQ